MSSTQPEHLSYSQFSQYERCPLSYQLRYVDRQARSTPSESKAFGQAIHATLEALYKHAQERGSDTLTCSKVVTECWTQVWPDSELTGLALFAEGLLILAAYVQRQGKTKDREVLGIEKHFRVPIGGYEIVGSIDRVDRLDGKSIEVVDYKTNRIPISHKELEHSLQLSIYHMAAQHLWPWAKRIVVSFELLRHRRKISTERTPAQLEAARRYIEAQGQVIRETKVYTPQLNAYCRGCDYRTSCPAYSEALSAPAHSRRGLIHRNIEDLAKERDEAAHKAKLFYARRRELDEALMAYLAENGELVVGSTRYTVSNKGLAVVESALAMLEQSTGCSRDVVLNRLIEVSPMLLGDFLGKLYKTLPRTKFKQMHKRPLTLAKRAYGPQVVASPIHK